METPKPTCVRDPDYLAWLREQRCLVPQCRRYAGSDPHHTKTKGAGGGDDSAVPLCRTHHREGHQLGWKNFERKYHVNLRMLAEVYWLSYQVERDGKEIAW